MKYTEKAYINANHHTKRFRSHRIASKKMYLLFAVYVEDILRNQIW